MLPRCSRLFWFGDVSLRDQRHVVIASYYVLFAVMGGSGHALIWELVFAAVFSTVALVGAFFFPTLVGMGIVAHGLFDFVHDGIVENAGVPTWWPGFCGSIDVVLGLWVISLARSREKQPGH